MCAGRLDRVTGQLVGANGVDPPPPVVGPGAREVGSDGVPELFLTAAPSQSAFDEDSVYSSPVDMRKEEGGVGENAAALEDPDLSDDSPQPMAVRAPERPRSGSTVCPRRSFAIATFVVTSHFRTEDPA
jgi:hypothetical protein